MEVDYFVIALEKALTFLRKSESPLYSNLTIEEMIRELDKELAKRNNSQLVNIERIRFLFAPTGIIQEISIDNGWEKEFLEITAWF